MTHENMSQSPLNSSIVDSCSVLHVNEFTVDASALTSPAKVKKIIKDYQGTWLRWCSKYSSQELRRVVLHVKGRRGQKLHKLLARGCDISLASSLF
jgi:hypothetical protein